MRDHVDEDHYEPGELFVYVNGDRWELGMVKRPAGDDHYFCWYSRGDTAARTSTINMCKLENAGFTHVEKLLESAENAKAENDKLRKRMEWLEDELRKQGSAAGKFMSMAGTYQKDNRKLRELYAYFLRQMKLAGCFDCFNGNCEEWGKCGDECTFKRRARELGIEDEP